MEYTKIYYESFNIEAKYLAENFCKVELFKPSEGWPWPYLLHIQHGNNQCEDWDTEWEMLHLLGDAIAIRQTITKLDTYVFKQEVSHV